MIHKSPSHSERFTQSYLQDCPAGIFLFLSSAKVVIPTNNRKGLSESSVQQSLRSYRREIWLISLDGKHAAGPFLSFFNTTCLY